MQQAPKGKGAIKINTMFKPLLLFLSLLLIFSASFAQSDDFEFQRSFIKAFKYPESLRRSCTPTFTNILIEISAEGIIQSISISDSAPKSFKDEFNEIKKTLDVSTLKSTINYIKLKNCNLLIPVFYVYGSDYCVNSFEPVGYIADNYFSFNGKKLDRLVYNLKPIINSLYKPLH